MQLLPGPLTRIGLPLFWVAVLLAAGKAVPAQTPPVQAQPAIQTVPLQGAPIAIIPIDSSDPSKAATVRGALEVAGGKAIIAASGTITSGSQTTRVILPHRGELRVCAASSVKLAADSNVAAGEAPGLLMAMDHGAVELSFAATSANLKNADTLLTPDFRILIGGPGSADVKVRLGRQGDTCIDNAGANAPYVLVSSVFEGGAYRVQPGQHIMFQHGSLHEVVDQEKEPCGCPPPEPQGNEFPLAQSEGLAPTPKLPSAPAVSNQGQTQAEAVPPLVYKSVEHASKAAIEAQPAPATTAGAQPAASLPAPQKKPSFFTRVGHFFRRIFGAEG